jgi:hypothetical protein
MVTFPAASETLRVALRSVPSDEMVLFAGHDPSMPESASEHDQAIATWDEYQPAGFGAVVGAPLSVGAVSSMFTVTLMVALLSALSTAVPVTAWLEPSPVNILVPLQLLIPDSASEHAKLTATADRFQPFALAAGEALPTMVGAVSSSLTVTEPLPVLPRRSTAVEVRAVPAVFAVTESVAGLGPEPTPEPVSAADHVMATFDPFHPAGFGAGVADPVTVGPVLSRTYEADCGPCDWPVH